MGLTHTQCRVGYVFGPGAVLVTRPDIHQSAATQGAANTITASDGGNSTCRWKGCDGVAMDNAAEYSDSTKIPQNEVKMIECYALIERSGSTLE